MTALGILCVLFSLLWAAPALFFRAPFASPLARRALAGGWVVLGIAAIVLAVAGHAHIGFGLYGLAFIGLLMWWASLRPSHQRLWEEDVSRLPYATRTGDQVTLGNVRNFRWHSAAEATPAWETRHYDLATLTHLDVALSYWMGPAIAHTLVLFGFADGRSLAFSIEIRKKRGERFNAIGGMFRQFEACLVAADERDILAVRTNQRGEDVYLYRVLMPQAAIRSLFLSYLETARTIAGQPRFYNTLTANCTTMVYEMVRRIVHGLPLDYRLILSGYLPEYLQKVQALMPAYELADLRAGGRITDRARSWDGQADFSHLIRTGMPGYDATGRALPVLEDPVPQEARPA